jgi:hypothetical protein
MEMILHHACFSGRPFLKFKEAMKAEHCELYGCNEKFETSNYGVVTCPKDEWEIVVEDKVCKDTGHQRRIPKWTFTLIEVYREGHKQSVPKWSFWTMNAGAQVVNAEAEAVALKAGLMEVEVIAVILYTGPMVVERPFLLCCCFCFVV